MSHLRHTLHQQAYLDGLSEQTKRDVENFIRERKVDERGGGVWGTVKWVGLIALSISVLLCLLYLIYRCFKNRSSPQ